VDESTGLLLGVCGLGITCTGVMVFLALAFFRVTGRSLLAFLPGRDSGTPAIARLSRRRINLRERAKAVDFDSALQTYAARQSGRAPEPPATLPPRFDKPARPPSAFNLRRRLRPRDEDEIFGGLLDIDGDGEPDL